MEGFLTWDILLTFSGLVSSVYMVVEFTKELPLIRKMNTRYWSFIIALILIILTNVVVGTYKSVDIVLYALTSMSISLSSNGLSDFSKGLKKNKNNPIKVEEGENNE